MTAAARADSGTTRAGPARSRRWPRALALAAGLLALAVMFGWQLLSTRKTQRADASLRQRLAQVVPAPAGLLQPCNRMAPAHARVVLVLGQSNAANHGSPWPADVALPSVTLATPEGCLMASDPLPGGTGQGGSIWSRLPAALRAGPSASALPPLLLSVLAVDATTMADWTTPHSPLHQRLLQHLQGLAGQGRSPSLVLWHQGESDARLGTSAATYAQGLHRLADLVQTPAGGVRLLVARSTVCRQAPSETLHRAVADAVRDDPRLRLGPQFDQVLTEDQRADGCHLNLNGLDRAAQLWADVIRLELLSGNQPIPRPS